MKIKSAALALASFALLSMSASAQNDECAGATVATTGSTPFDTTTATPSSTPWGCGVSNSPDLWYSFTAPSTADYDIDLCGSTFNSLLEVYTGPCTSLVSLACNDDFCVLDAGLPDLPLNAGDVIHLRVGGFQANSGVGTLNITELSPPPPPSGSVTAWLTAVGTGTPASYVNSNLVAPIEDDIGLTSGGSGVTYEFIVYGDNFGASSALMGALGTSVGDSAALKFEQWPDTLHYGITEFGVADFQYSAINTTHVDIQLVFLADTSTDSTELFVDGVSAGTAPYAPVLQGYLGIGQVYRAAGNLDLLERGAIRGVAVYEGLLSMTEMAEHRDAYVSGSLGTTYCAPAVPNASGNPASILGTGSTSVASNQLTLRCVDMPTTAFGFFLASRVQGMVAQPGGSLGVLCLGGAIGRYVGPGQILNSGGAGEISLLLDLTMVPQPTGFVTVLPGETWNFTTWFRDNAAGQATSNFSNGVSLDFL